MKKRNPFDRLELEIMLALACGGILILALDLLMWRPG